jgi:hypothetical protein
VDEYNLVTFTRKFRPPDWLTLVQWLAWSMAGQVADMRKPLLDSLMAVLREPGRIWVDPNALWELRQASMVGARGKSHLNQLTS